jgi:3-hydroxypropanoate dehydrogenase
MAEHPFHHDPLGAAALDQIFRHAHTSTVWSDRPVSENQIRELYDLLKLGPTAANGSPARFVWVRSDEGRAKLSALASDGNKAKILKAPVTAIVGYDIDFHEKMPQLFPARGAAMKENMGKQSDTQREVGAFRNSSLQGAYMIIAARALGLDCGPMSGFNNADVDNAFFPGGRIKSNFICSLGYGEESGVFPRNPRLSFEEAGRFA